MVKAHALTKSVSANLHEFLHSIDTDLTRLRKKFLRDGLVALLRAGRARPQGARFDFAVA